MVAEHFEYIDFIKMVIVKLDTVHIHLPLLAQRPISKGILQNNLEKAVEHTTEHDDKIKVIHAFGLNNEKVKKLPFSLLKLGTKWEAVRRGIEYGRCIDRLVLKLANRIPGICYLDHTVIDDAIVQHGIEELIYLLDHFLWMDFGFQVPIVYEYMLTNDAYLSKLVGPRVKQFWMKAFNDNPCKIYVYLSYKQSSDIIRKYIDVPWVLDKYAYRLTSSDHLYMHGFHAKVDQLVYWGDNIDEYHESYNCGDYIATCDNKTYINGIPYTKYQSDHPYIGLYKQLRKKKLIGHIPITYHYHVMSYLWHGSKHDNVKEFLLHHDIQLPSIGKVGYRKIHTGKISMKSYSKGVMRISLGYLDFYIYIQNKHIIIAGCKLPLHPSNIYHVNCHFGSFVIDLNNTIPTITPIKCR